MGYYDTAQICTKGHTVTRSADTHPDFRSSYCPKCGAPTIMACPSCGRQIKGHYHSDEGGIAISASPPPSYCDACGRPYPWTELGIQAAKELADEVEGLDDQERETLKESIVDIATENPRTELGATRVKRIIDKVGQEAGAILREVIIRVAVDGVKGKL